MKSIILNNPRAILLGGLMLFVSSLGWAQNSSAADGVAQGDQAGETIRVIDNRGTIKYLQSNNGITTITSTETNNTTTTTWQLGGTLTTDTYIDVDGNVFAFDGIELVDISALAASTNASDQSDSGTGTGWTLLVRDEATGAVKKLLATDLLQGGHHYEKLAGDQNSDYTFTATGVSTDYKKVSVYRNGAKLVGGDTSSSWTNDYSVTTDQVTINIGDTGEISNLYTNDVIEVHWVK